MRKIMREKARNEVILRNFDEIFSKNFVIFGRLYNFASLYAAGACMLPSGGGLNN